MPTKLRGVNEINVGNFHRILLNGKEAKRQNGICFDFNLDLFLFCFLFGTENKTKIFVFISIWN